ncbi:hypothetical protein [Undibacterium sp.]|uniref:hypothetical protein n=1 Tax=Undibacterium sp. TaxID=1914977 RepID=UPI002B7F9A23|nr:hypothetical protein [Undibacterium sp.]HTD05992.1 hypothetical protein [Undibacterium sp.]
MVELTMFRDFAQRTGLPVVDTTIEKRCGDSEPDILCTLDGEGKVAFELVEICDPMLAANIAYSIIGSEATEAVASDPSTRIVRKKLNKTYRADCPVELICYTNGRTMTADHEILAAIQPWFNAIKGPFRRAWLLGKREVYEVWSL